MKKTVSILLAVIICITAAVFAPAAEDFSGEYLRADAVSAVPCGEKAVPQEEGAAAAPASRKSAERIEPLPFIYLPVCLLIGLIIALAVVGSMKASMRSVGMQAQANNYTKEGSFSLTEKQDIFLYSNLERTPRPKSNDEDK